MQVCRRLDSRQQYVRGPLLTKAVRAERYNRECDENRRNHPASRASCAIVQLRTVVREAVGVFHSRLRIVVVTAAETIPTCRRACGAQCASYFLQVRVELLDSYVAAMAPNCS